MATPKFKTYVVSGHLNMNASCRFSIEVEAKNETKAKKDAESKMFKTKTKKVFWVSIEACSEKPIQ
jgi:hypothetical protein